MTSLFSTILIILRRAISVIFPGLLVIISLSPNFSFILGPRLTGMGRIFAPQPDESRRRDLEFISVGFRPSFAQSLLDDCGDYASCKAQLIRFLASNLSKQRKTGYS